jgi:hypothetical protein
MLSKLENVSEDVLDMFGEAAKQFLATNDHNAVMAVSKALAFISGHSGKIGGRSLLTGEQNMVSMLMSSSQNSINKSACQTILARGWSGIADSIRQIRSVRQGKGAVFDIHEN